MIDINGDSCSPAPADHEVEFSTATYGTHYPGAVKTKAYKFDGHGNYVEKNWDLLEASGSGNEFYWYNVEVPEYRREELTNSAVYLMDVLCPPLKLQDILSLVSNGSFCGHVDGALVFRLNSRGPASTNFPFRLAARVTKNSLITVSLRSVARLNFALVDERPSWLSSIPSAGEWGEWTMKQELELLLDTYHHEEADTIVPKSVSNLVVYVIDAHVDHIRDRIILLEDELDSMEHDLDKGISALKINDRWLPKMRLDLQHLLQVIALGEQVLPRVREKCTFKDWFGRNDISALEEIIGRLRMLKENVEFLNNRVTTFQTSLDGFQASLDRKRAEQINQRLYYLSIISIIFLPLSIITGVFGMNVRGIPWTGEMRNSHGFRNVLLVCLAILVFALLCFFSPVAYVHIVNQWRRIRARRRAYNISSQTFLSMRRSSSKLTEDY